MAMVIEAELFVMTFPPASSTCTVTAGVITEPTEVFEGPVPNANCVGAP
jgi:hypothetical protein